MPHRRKSGSYFVPVPYEILGELGRGGMGVVYKARHLKLGRVVALKMVLHAEHAQQGERDRFLAEAEAVAHLHHPNVVQLYDSGTHDGLPYFTLEFVPGGSLADKLCEHPLNPTDAARLVQGIARGVQHAHEKGIIHRDLKPANVLLTEDGTPKVTDFGLARRVEAAGLTATGAVLGTPSYMAPEQASGQTKKVGPEADVYALGAVLYECLTGRPPFRAAMPLETLLQVLGAEAVAVRSLQANVPRDLETICHKCLQKEPIRRYASARELADDLGRFGRGEPIQARPVGAVERGYRWVKRNLVVSALATAVVLVLVAGILVSNYFAVTASREAIRATESERLAKDSNHAIKIDLALRAREQSDWERMRQLLDETDADYGQTFENGFVRNLWARHAFPLKNLIGHDYGVSSLAFSPDGKRIVTGSFDMTARVWDADTGTEKRALQGTRSP